MSIAMILRHLRIWGVCLVFAAPVVALAAAPGALARSAPDSFAPLVKRVLPAVVNIAVTQAASREDVAQLPPELRGTPFEKQLRERQRSRGEKVQGAGSGFIIDPSGIIVTNNHVVGRATKIIVALADGRALPAKLIGTDELTDVAVIRVSANGPLPYVTLGDSRAVEVGDWILAAGNPFGLGGSVTAGIVSARGRDLGAGPFDDFLQLDASINPGNSGGPTFNMDGQVVGMNTAIVSPTGGSVGIGFAIPSEIIGRIVADLRSKGHIDRGWLGVSVEDESEHGGAAIAGVIRAGPAARSGLRPGDIVVAVDGAVIEGAKGLIKQVASLPPGSTVHLSVQRQGRAADVPVQVGLRPANDTE